MTPNETPLESWKEIGAYLQRDSTTARRWEKEEGLPVHRHSHKARSSVYAYPSEIDAWRASRKAIPEPRPLWKSLLAPPRAMALGATLLMCLIMVGNGVRPATAQSQPAPFAPRVCSACQNINLPATVTPDGQWLTTSVDDGTLLIRNLMTGAGRSLSTQEEAGEHAEWAMLSPDLSRAVYLWWDTNGETDHHQLRLVGTAPGSIPRVIADSPEFPYFETIGWAPDSASVYLLGFKPDDTWQLVRVAVPSGSVQVLKSLGWRMREIRGGGMSLSPDGRYLAYSALAVNPDGPKAPVVAKDQHVYVLATDGSSETELVKSAGINEQPSWTPDGAHLLFVSDRSGKFDLWSQSMQGAAGVGTPVPVMADIGRHWAMGVSRSGSYYYQQNFSDVEYVTVADLREGATARVVENFVGIRPVWSPDGKAIAFKRHRPGTTNYDLLVRSVDTGDERRYPTTLGTLGAGVPNWFRDGKALMVGVGTPGGSGAWFRVDVNSGDYTRQNAGLLGPTIALSSDDRTMYVLSRDSPEGTAPSPGRILALDLASGASRPVLTIPEMGAAQRLVLSPDGRTLAFSSAQQLRRYGFATVGVDGGQFREIYAAAGSSGNLAWTADGRGLLFDQRDGRKVRIMRIAADGGTPEPTGLDSEGPIQNITVDPAGRRIAFGSVRSGSQILVLDNVLSALK